MKKIYYIAMFTAALAGCSKNIVPQDDSMPRTVNVVAEIGSNEENSKTKVEYSPDWNSAMGYSLKNKWETQDKLSIICWQGDDSQWNKGMPSAEKTLYLQSSHIIDNGRKIKFNFKLPNNITDNSKPIKVLVTYLGQSTYKMRTNGDTSWGLNLAGGENNYTSPLDFEKLKYLDNQAPMIYKGEIPAGWDKKNLPELTGKFKHLSTVFAIQIANNSSYTIQPSKIGIKFSGSKVIDAQNKMWNPVQPSATDASANQFVQMSIISDQNPYTGDEYTFQMNSNTTYVFFLPTIIFQDGSPKGLSLYFEGDYRLKKETEIKSISKVLEAGKCYSLSAEITKNKDLKWTEDHSSSGQYGY